MEQRKARGIETRAQPGVQHHTNLKKVAVDMLKMVLIKRDAHDLGHDLYQQFSQSFHVEICEYMIYDAFFLPRLPLKSSTLPKSDDRNAATKPAKRRSSFGKTVLMLVNQ